MKAYLLQSFRHGSWAPIRVVLDKDAAVDFMNTTSDRYPINTYIEIELDSAFFPIPEGYCGMLKHICEQTQEAYAENRKLLADMQYLESRLRDDLKRLITYWREIREGKSLRAIENPDLQAMAECYIDAFQVVHNNMFGELVP